MSLTRLIEGIWPLASVNTQSLQACRPLSRVDCATIQPALSGYANDSFYCAAVSMGESIAGAISCRYSWAAIKAYYTLFYAVRSICARDLYFLFSVGRSQLTSKGIPGQIPVKVVGSSHAAMFSVFRTNFPNNPLLSGQIDQLDPIDWMKDIRNEMNYRQPRFREPEITECFQAFSKRPRRMLTEYMDRQYSRFTFDPDHAVLAFPLAALWEARRTLNADSTPGEAEAAHLRSICQSAEGDFYALLASKGII